MTPFSYFVGIDPGRHGALAVLNGHGQLLALRSLPTLPQAGFIKTRLDAVAFCRFFDGLASDRLAAVESVWVRDTDSRSGGAALVQSAALAEGVLVGLGATVIRPTPQQWRLAMLPKGARGKGASLQRARALWPGVTWEDDNKAEAALLARFAWLQRERDLRGWGAPQAPKKKARVRRTGPTSNSTAPEPATGA
jgi:hypothetical protein